MSHNIALILGQFHHAEAQVMQQEAARTAEENGLVVVEQVWVPGSMETPLAAKRLLLRDDIDALVVLGIIERGETEHGTVMGHAVVKALIDLQLQFMKPIGMGLLGPGIQPSQIPSRVSSYARSATLAASHMLKSA